MAKTNPCQGEHREFHNFVKTQGKRREFCLNTEFCKLSCKCSDSKSKGYCDSCRKKIHFFSRSWIGLPSQFCVCNTHKLCKLAQGKFAVRQGKYRENTGNLKIQFEWVPCNRRSIKNTIWRELPSRYGP